MKSTSHPTARGLLRRGRRCQRLLLAALLPTLLAAQQIVQVPDPAAGSRAPSATADAPRSATVPGRYIVQFVPGTPPAARAAAAAQIGAVVVHNYAFSSSIAIAVPDERALNGLRQSRSVWQIIPDEYIPLAAKPSESAPKEPNNVAASVSGSDVLLTWNDRANNEDGFRVQRCIGAGCTGFADHATVPANTTSFTDAGLSDGDYRYRVIAFNTNGDSPPSNTADATVSTGGEPTPPAAPSNLSASVSGSDVNLTWSDQSDDEDGFRVQRCSGSGCTGFADLATVAANTTSFTDTGLSDGDYRYQVIAFNAAGDSAPSNAADATVSSGGEPDPPNPDGAVRGTQQVLTYEVQRVGRPVAGSTGLGIGVAVVDTGIDYFHADLAPAPDNPGTVNPDTGESTGTSFNALSPGSSCQDEFSHGTHLAGLIGAPDNNIGMAGVAPQATMYCVKIGATDEGLIALSDLQAGLEWVLASHARVSPPIRVVNLSLAAPPPDSGDPVDPARAEIDNLIQQLYQQGVATVAAAGNDPTRDVSEMFPASVANVISVAGTTATDGLNTCGAPPEWVLADTAYGGAGKGTTDGTGITTSAPAEERADLIPFGTGCLALYYGTLSTSLTTADGAPGIDDLITRKLPAPLGPVEARGTSFSAALVSGVLARYYQAQLEAGTLSGTASDVDGVRSSLVNAADRVSEAPLDHPWAGQGDVVYDFDGVREGIAQAPMPAP